MLRGVTVVGTDDAVRWQGRVLRLYAPRFVETRPPARLFRYFLPYRDLPVLASQLASAAGTAVLLGAGEYHHLSAALLLSLRAGGSRPAVVVFDAHPDWSIAPVGYLHCGSWLPEVLAMPHVRAVALVGVGSLASRGLLKAPVLHAVVPAARSGRLRVYPVLRATAEELRSAGWPGDTLSLEDDQEAVAGDLLEFVRGGPVYLSIDKDVVRPDELPGNWGDGQIEGDRLLRLVARLASERELTGADVCGEYAPRLPLPGADPALARHQAFNLKLLERLVGRTPSLSGTQAA